MRALFCLHFLFVCFISFVGCSSFLGTSPGVVCFAKRLLHILRQATSWFHPILNMGCAHTPSSTVKSTLFQIDVWWKEIRLNLHFSPKLAVFSVLALINMGCRLTQQCRRDPRRRDTPRDMHRLFPQSGSQCLLRHHLLLVHCGVVWLEWQGTSAD